MLRPTVIVMYWIWPLEVEETTLLSGCVVYEKEKKNMNEDRKKAWNLDAKAVYGTAFKISATLSVFFLRGRT